MAQVGPGGGVPGSLEAFVGRAGELAALDTALDGALGGRGRLVLVSGEAGIGKTYLVEQVTAHATDRDMAVLWATCWDGPGAPPFWPWTQVARAYERLHNRATLVADLGVGVADVTALSQDPRARGRRRASPG